MRARPLGQSGIEASVVAFGAWAIGGWMWGGADEGQAIRAIHVAIDVGVNLIDTAPVYGFGRSEEIVGRAIAGRRDRVVIATKCGLVWNTDKGKKFFESDDVGVGHGTTTKRVRRYLAPVSIRQEIEDSLRRLRVDAIDLYQTHWQDPTTRISDTMDELLRLKAAGKICAIGVSNATPEQLDEYRCVGPVDVDQERFNMLDRQRAQDSLPYCAQNGVAFLAYSTLAHGLLTGKLAPDRVFGEGDLRAANPRYSIENRRRVIAMFDDLLPVTEARGITFSQLAIAWTLHQPACTHALVGARNPSQALENAAAGDITFTDDEVAHINAVLAQHAPDIK